MPFFLLFLAIPFIEIWLFLTVADNVSLGAAFGGCILSAALGFFILQEQGFRAMTAARAELAQNSDPLPEIFDGLCVALAGGMLIVPGFLTDALALLLLLPFIRRHLRGAIGRRFARHFNVVHARTDETIIDAEYEEIPPPSLPRRDDKP